MLHIFLYILYFRKLSCCLLKLILLSLLSWLLKEESYVYFTKSKIEFVFYYINRYYSGEKKAPILTIFVGGNHEASNYLQELPYGGWVAPNIYYMGKEFIHHIRIIISIWRVVSNWVVFNLFAFKTIWTAAQHLKKSCIYNVYILHLYFQRFVTYCALTAIFLDWFSQNSLLLLSLISI